MVLCRINILGLCTVLCLMTIYGVDVYDTECGEYIIVFEETTCHHNNSYSFKPLKMEQIQRNNLTYPCNSTDKDQGKKKCLIEFDCRSKQRECQNHVIPKNSFIADSHIAAPTENTTKAGVLPITAAETHTVTRVENRTEAGGLSTTANDNHTVTRVENTTEAGGLSTIAADNHTVTRVENTTEAGGLSTTATDNHTVTRVENTTEAGVLPITAAETHTVTWVERTTEAGGVINNNITVEQETHRKMHGIFNTTTCDVNIIYIQNSSERTNDTKKPRNQVFQCKYAEIVCENYSLSDFKNDINDTHHYEPPETLIIEISRDETSKVQPLFTGYFPESSNDSTTNYNHHFQGIMHTSCSIQKDGNCKQNIDSLKYINIYLKANYVENNTVTKYPNCIKDSLTPKNELIVKCEDISFAKHNPHILQGPPPPPQKQKPWNCQIIEFKNTSKEQRSENNKIRFINCSNETKIISNKNKSEEMIVVPISDIKNLSGMKINKTEISSGKEVTNIDISSQINLENIITFLITENPNNCSHNSSLNINEGKIIDLGLNNNKDFFFQNNNVDIILSNCISDQASIINNKQPPLITELIIILKNESLNTSNLKRFNGTMKDESVTQRILLRCDHIILNVSSNTTSNTTELQCESIDLDLYDITGIEIVTNLTQLSHVNNTKKNLKNDEEIDNKVKANANNNFSTNQTAGKNYSTVNNNINENKTKEVQKNITESNKNNKTKDENKEIRKNISDSKEYIKNQNFNRRKDIPDDMGQNSLALESTETEKILLIALLCIAGGAILIVIVLRVCTKKKEYNPAPTREPPDEEETAF